MTPATVYLLTFPNGKQYVGATVQDINSRIAGHRSRVRDQEERRKSPVHRAWQEFGEPTVRVLLVTSRKDMDAAEHLAIAMYGTLAPDGYNMESGGRGSFKMHSETKRRIAVGRKGVPLSPTHRANVVAALEANRKSGDEHPNATLNEAAVARIFELRKGGMLLREIGDAVGVSLAQVGNILRGSRRGTQTEGLRGEALPKPSVRDSACDAMRAARAVRDAWTTARLVEIQRRSDAGESDAALAAVYGLGVATIYAMRRRTGVYKPGYVNTKSRRSAPPTPARDRGHRGRCDALPRR